MNSYRNSSGNRIPKSTIDSKIAKAKTQKRKDQYLAHGFNFCEECGINDRSSIIDVSHVISTDECQKSGRSELAWDLDNLTMLCRRCHQKRDNLFLDF